MVDTIGGKAKEVGTENKLFDFDLVIKEKTKKIAGDGKEVRVKKQQPIKILWKKYESGKVVGQPVMDREIIHFEKDGKKYDIEIKELLLNKGIFSDRVEFVVFSPDLRYIPFKVRLEDYPPYGVYNLDHRDFQSGVKLVKPWKTGRIVGAGVLLAVSLGIGLFYLIKFLKRVKITIEPTKSKNKNPLPRQLVTEA